MVTETDELARALADAARRWPNDRRNRRKLLLRLVEEGHRAIEPVRHDPDERLAAIKATAGALTGCFPPGYLEELRRDWPE